MTTTTAHQTRLVERIRSALLTLTPAERRVAEVVLGDPLAVLNLSVSEIASKAATSTASVVRLCSTVGLRGFQDLKVTLATEAIPEQNRVLAAIEPGDAPSVVAAKVLGTSARAIDDAVHSLDASSLEQAAMMLLGARNIMFAGVGTSAPLASDAAYRFTTLGLSAMFIPDVHQQHVTARMLGLDDVLVAVSHTGSTTETLAVAKAAKQAGATTIALTSFTSSPLTEIVDHALVAGSSETSYRVEAMVSRLVHLAVIDALYVLISMRRSDGSDALARTESIITEHRI